MFKQLFCKHEWASVKRIIWFPYIYGCTKCGKIEEVHVTDDERWRFKRDIKGDTFE